MSEFKSNTFTYQPSVLLMTNPFWGDWAPELFEGTDHDLLYWESIYNRTRNRKDEGVSSADESDVDEGELAASGKRIGISLPDKSINRSSDPTSPIIKTEPDSDDEDFKFDPSVIDRAYSYNNDSSEQTESTVYGRDSVNYFSTDALEDKKVVPANVGNYPINTDNMTNGSTRQSQRAKNRASCGRQRTLTIDTSLANEVTAANTQKNRIAKKKITKRASPHRPVTRGLTKKQLAESEEAKNSQRRVTRSASKQAEVKIEDDKTAKVKKRGGSAKRFYPTLREMAKAEAKANSTWEKLRDDQVKIAYVSLR